MNEIDVSVCLDMILKSADPVHVDVRRAIVEEIVDRFHDVLCNLKMPSGITWDGFVIDGEASLGEDRKVSKTAWNDLAMVSRGVGRKPDHSRRG